MERCDLRVFLLCLTFFFIFSLHTHTHTHTQEFCSVQSLNNVQLFATPWIAVCQASLSITNSRSLLKPMSFELVMPSNLLILCRPFLLLPSVFPSNKVFSNESILTSGGQSTGVSASASVLSMNIQD